MGTVLSKKLQGKAHYIVCRPFLCVAFVKELTSNFAAVVKRIETDLPTRTDADFVAACAWTWIFTRIPQRNAARGDANCCADDESTFLVWSRLNPIMLPIPSVRLPPDLCGKEKQLLVYRLANASHCRGKTRVQNAALTLSLEAECVAHPNNGA